jgi:hypothetical protein
LARALKRIQIGCLFLLSDDLSEKPRNSAYQDDAMQAFELAMEIVHCPHVRKLIQSMGSHACWAFARIDDLVGIGGMHILNWLDDADYHRKLPTKKLRDRGARKEIPHSELGQLSEWLTLISGAKSEAPYLGITIRNNEVERIGFDSPVDLNDKPKQRLFLELLISERGTPIVRDDALDMIYSSHPSSGALANLRSALNKSLEPLRVEVDKHNILVDMGKPTNKQTAGKPAKKKTR